MLGLHLDLDLDLSALTTDTPLPLLGPHLPTLVLSAAGFYAVQSLSHRVGRRLVGRWDGFDTRTKKGWASHVVCEWTVWMRRHIDTSTHRRIGTSAHRHIWM
jgi:hypothetical protein